MWSERLTDWIRHENVPAFAIVVLLVEIASAGIVSTGAGRLLLGRLYQEIILFGLQFGVLSCLGLWIALGARSWRLRIPVAAAVIAASVLVFARLKGGSLNAGLATIMVGHVVLLSFVAFGLRVFGFVHSPTARHATATPSQFRLKQVFAWTAVVAVLAFLSRFAAPPRSLEIVFILGSCPVLAVAIALVMSNVKSSLLQLLLLLLPPVGLAMLLPGLTQGDEIEEFLTFELVQATVIVAWFGVWRTSRSVFG